MFAPLKHGSRPTEVNADRASAYPRVIEELIVAVCHVTERYVNNSVEADQGHLKARLRLQGRGAQEASSLPGGGRSTEIDTR